MIVLLTGGSRGIGKGIKEFFEKDEPSLKLKLYNKNQKSFKKNNKTSNNNKTVKKK